MSYKVNLGCWGSIFAVPCDVVDKYLKIAGSAQLKVLLWILRHSGEEFETDTVASALNMGSFDVRDCIEFWVSFGVISADNNVITPAGSPHTTFSKTEQSVPAAQEQKNIFEPEHTETINNTQQTGEMSQTVNSEKKASPPARPLRPDPGHIADRMSEDSEIAALLNEAQYIFGRPVSHNENAGILMMHDNDGLPVEVILMLLTYGVENKKGMRYIEAMGKQWADEGIFTAQLADEKIRRLEESREAWHRVQSVLGFDLRSPSASEEEMYTNWIKAWKFSDDMIKEAYDRCINSIGKYRASYVNSILMKWYQNGIKTIEQAKAEIKTKSKKKNNSEGVSTNSSFDIDELDDLAMFDD